MALKQYELDAAWATPIVDRHLETAPAEVRMAWRTFREAVASLEQLAKSTNAEEHASVCSAVSKLKNKLWEEDAPARVIYLIEELLEDWDRD